jgi:hypothetical protein
MPDDSKKIFVSYRRALSTDFVHRLRDHLKARGFDVFVDVQSIPSGKFAKTILHQIEARPHFLAVLVPGSLARTTRGDDWYRREIEHALETKRNIIPLLAKRFSFAEELQKLQRKTLPGRLEELKQYQYFSFIYEYDEQYQANIDVLVKRFLVIPEETRIVPTPKKERETVREMLKVADSATADRAGSDWILPLQSRFLFTPLGAPKLAAPANGKFTWTTVAGASGYVLQAASDEAFSKPENLYSGEETEFLQPPKLLGLSPLALAGLTPTFGTGLGTNPIGAGLWTSGLFGTRYYRVKAKAGLGRLDSPWSNTVKVEPPKPLSAPKLDVSWRLGTVAQLTWSAVDGAIGYLLQTSTDRAFTKPEELYNGKETEFLAKSESPGQGGTGSGFGSLVTGTIAGLPEPNLLFTRTTPRYYRVKAVAGPGRLDSPWSDVV